MSRRIACALLAALAARPAQGAALPDWLEQAVARSAPAGSGRAGAIVLHDEQIVAVPSRGRTVVTTRQAVRVITRDAKDLATATAHYLRGTSEVTGFKTWTLGPAGNVVRRSDRRDAADVSGLQSTQLATDSRRLVFTDDAIELGQTFAWESVVEEEPLVAQWKWLFRSRYPCALSRFDLRLPGDLGVRVHSAHLDSARTGRQEGRWTWELRDQPAALDEPLAPERLDLDPYLCVQAVPASGDRSPAGIAFRDWPSVARWIDELAAGQDAVTPRIAETAARVAGRAPDSLARIRDIARYVQGLNYVAVEVNTGRGWGARPNAADAVLSTGHGDCKDKANLLRAMLRAAGHEAWLMPIYSGHRDRVDTAWADPWQFNHCIVAIRPPASFEGPLIDAGQAGRLLAFDPTDGLTTFGDLPEDQQGSWALLVGLAGGRLVRMPVLPAEQNRFERRADARLTSAGVLEATLVERSRGQAAREERAFRRLKNRSEYQSALESWLATQGGTVAIRSWAASEDTTNGRYELRVEYDSPTFARRVGDRMLTFRSALLSPRRRWTPTDTARTSPIALPATCVMETVTVRLPGEFALDERPADVHAESDLGRLHATWEVSEGSLVMVRRWELRPVTVGPERWRDVVDLYRARQASDEATVVLVRR